MTGILKRTCKTCYAFGALAILLQIIVTHFTRHGRPPITNTIKETMRSLPLRTRNGSRPYLSGPTGPNAVEIGSRTIPKTAVPLLETHMGRRSKGNIPEYDNNLQTSNIIVCPWLSLWTALYRNLQNQNHLVEHFHTTSSLQISLYLLP